MIHEFEPTHFHTTIGSHEPVLRVASGDVIRTWTVDSGGYDRNGNDIADGGNPQTGPFYVEGAERGDTLRVRLDRIRPNRTRGVTGGVIAPHVVEPGFVPELGPRDSEDWWTLDLERGIARLDDPPPGLESLGELPLDPMLGCFGVAPARGQAISCATSGEHGGNMDYRGFREGVTVDFPVFAEGALLHVGDGHALQGDGEIVGTGIEVSMDVELSVEVLKGKTIRWPRAEDETFVMAVGNARPLDQAVQHATTELLKLLRDDYGLDYRAGSALLGQCIRYDVGNVYDPAYTMVAKVEKALLGRL
ncbi:MAG TPA: acetamidase/formamidase family protein [Gaiellaceae bacterium]|nr:acetamidase/formamidase family protein [Gaiellaceae bacterium]